MRSNTLTLMLCCAVLTNCAIVAAPASKPAIASTLPYNDILAVQFDDKDGVFIEMSTFKQILEGVELEKGDLRNTAARSTARADFAEKRAAELERLAQEQITRATWGPVVGGALGVVVGAGGATACAAIVEAIRR
jgi:hypothetical protein